MNTALHTNHTQNQHWWAPAIAGAAALVIVAAAYLMHDPVSGDPLDKAPTVVPAEKPAAVPADSPAVVVETPAVVVEKPPEVQTPTVIDQPATVPTPSVAPSNGIVIHGASTGLEYVPRTEMTKPR